MRLRKDTTSGVAVLFAAAPGKEDVVVEGVQEAVGKGTSPAVLISQEGAD